MLIAEIYPAGEDGRIMATYRVFQSYTVTEYVDIENCDSPEDALDMADLVEYWDKWEDIHDERQWVEEVTE